MIKRKTTRFIDKRTDSQGRVLCLIPTCNNLPAKFKNGNNKNYCKDHSFLDMSMFVNWAALRKKALERDNYTCKNCKVKKRSRHLCGDHIIPVALGGEEFDLDNVQTLCTACHKIKTKEDMGDIAKQRRIDKTLANNQKTL